MESALSVTTTTIALSNASKALNLHFSRISQIQCLQRQLPAHRFCSGSGYSCLHRATVFGSTSFSSPRAFCAILPTLGFRFQCVCSSAASFASGGGTGGFGGENSGGGGGGGSDGGDAKSDLVAGGLEEVSALSSDVIVLDVRGMTCGGCAASVKRILEKQPQVSSASVNLTTETAVVWPVSAAKVEPNWHQQLGEALVKQLTSCGFASNLRGQEAIEGDISL